MSTILAFDPGLSPGTGYGCIRSAGRRPEIVEAGMIPLARRSLDVALAELADAVDEMLDDLAPDHIAVELPRKGGCKGLRRSLNTLPNYGCAVGVCVGAARRREVEATGVRKWLVTVDQWSGQGRVHPTGGGKKKPARIRDACAMFRLRPADLGAETNAPNIADALLLAGGVYHRVAKGKVSW